MNGATEQVQSQLEGATLGNQLDKLCTVAVVSCFFGLPFFSIPAAYYAFKARKMYKKGFLDEACVTGKRAYYLTMFAMMIIIVNLVPVIAIGGTICACVRKANTVEHTETKFENGQYTRTYYHNYEKAAREAEQIERGTCCAAAAVSTMGLYWWCGVPDPVCKCPWENDFPEGV